MAKAKKAYNSKKKPIEQYVHKGKQRANDPAVGFRQSFEFCANQF